MPIRRKSLFLTAIVALLTGCELSDFGSFGDSHAYEKDFHYSYPLKPGGRLSVENFNGSVEITGWDKDTVEIDGRQYASTPELRDAIKVDVAASEGLVQIRTIRPAGRHWNMGAKYIIRAPRKTNLDRIVSSNGAMKVDAIEGVIRLRTTNGSIRTSRARGDVDASTTNGGIDIEDLDGPATIRTTNGRVTAEGIRGSLQASTSNGPIHARLVKPEAHRPVKLQTTNGGIDLTMDSLADNEIRASTSNGGITVKLPSTAGAHVHAHTSHSSIHTDFDLKQQEGRGKNNLDGVIGDGGATVELTSTNGSIRLLKL
jgi:putative adhesin